MAEFVSRAGQKLEHAIAQFHIDVAGMTCADLGCNTGGFVDCLLQRGAARVYAVDTGYGVLDWKLRKDPRVVVMERTNAMHVELPEQMDLISIDVAWTRQHHILPSAARLLKPTGTVVTLVKPHYEADKTMLKKGILPEELFQTIVGQVREGIEQTGWIWEKQVISPIKGTGGNAELLAMLRNSPKNIGLAPE